MLGLFLKPLDLGPIHHQFWFMLPLCLAVAVVYRTTKCERLSDVPLAAAKLWLSIMAFMVLVGASLLAVYLVATR